MQLAIPIWQERISPVFDVASELLLVRFAQDREIGREKLTLDARSPISRAHRLIECQIDVLICGAISLPLETMLKEVGVRVVRWVSGEVETILTAFFENGLSDPSLRMPVCRRSRRRCGRGWGRGRGGGVR